MCCLNDEEEGGGLGCVRSGIHTRGEEIWAAMEVELGSSSGEVPDSGGGRSSVGDGDGSPERGSAHGVRLEIEVEG